MFRVKRGLLKAVNYNEQGYICFLSLRYKKASRAERAMIRRCCARTGYSGAVFEFVTGSKGAVYICGKYFISESTLERAVREYYIAMKQELNSRDRE